MEDFDEFYEYYYTKSPYTDSSFTYTRPNYQAPCDQTPASNIQLIKNGDQTVVQLSFEQLQKFMSSNNQEVQSNNTSFDSFIPSRDNIYTSSYCHQLEDHIEPHDKRTKSQSFPKRALGHHVIEKRYRQNLNDKISRLKDLVLGTSSKVSKGAILDEAAEAIIRLKNQVTFLQNRLHHLESGTSPKSSSLGENFSPEAKFVPSDINYAECGQFVFCFFFLIVFFLNPLSYLLQPHLSLSFSSLFSSPSSIQTRSLLSHGFDPYSSLMGPLVSFTLFLCSQLLNIFVPFLFLINFVVLSLKFADRSSWESAKDYVEKAKNSMKRGSTLETENNVFLAQSSLGFSSPSRSLISAFLIVPTLFQLILAILFCPIIKIFDIFSRKVMLYDLADFNEYLKLVAHVSTLRGMMIAKRGSVDSFEEARLLLNGIVAAILSGNSLLVSQICSVTAMAFRCYSYNPIKSFCSFMLMGVGSTVSTANDQSVVKLADELLDENVGLGDYERISDYNAFVCLGSIDSRLIKCMNGLDCDYLGIGQRIDFAESLCGDLAHLLDYRRSILALVEYRAKGIRSKEAIGFFHEPLMICAGMLLRIDSQMHVCSLSSLPDVVKLCEEANGLLLSCELSGDDLLSKHFYVFVSRWVLSLRQNLLTYAECLVSTDSIVSLFENDFVDVCDRASQLEGTVLDDMARFSKLWARL